MSSVMRFDEWQNSQGMYSSTPLEVAPAYAQINKIAGQSFGAGHQNILWDEIPVSKNITLSGNQIYFAVPGVYHITVGLRVGTAGDIWTGMNVYHPGTSTMIANSYGTGNVTNDPGPLFFALLVNITNVNSPYQIRLYRDSGSLSQATPVSNAGRAIVGTIVKVG